MSFKYLAYALFFSIACLGTEVDVELRLKTLAETQELGYKTANLYELRYILQNSDLGGDIELRVPDFYPISSSQIQSYLTENGLYLTKEWDNLFLPLLTKEQARILEGEQMRNQSFSLGLQKIREKIQAVFDRPVASPSLFSKQLLSFIEKSSSLIVRSSGREDQIGFANAGGNTSIKEVPPSLQKILHAIGEVIASYFSEKSISQRLLFKDQTLFEVPLTPVLIQEMVQAADRPIEAVVHTTEQSGPTPELVSFNCGYDVVVSKVRSDLYYYFPSKTGHAILAKNVEHLPENCRIAIATLAKVIQDHYKQPTDIELLVTKHADIFTIHLVQARPLCRPCYTCSPDFIANLAELPKDRIFRAETVVAAGSYTRSIRNRNQLILARTLKEAEEQFLFNTPEKEKIEAIIVQSEAEPNSHEATTFAGCGKIVLRIADFECLHFFLESGAFTFDPQQGVIAKEDEERSIIVTEGFVTHPMPCQASIETFLRTEYPFPIQDHLPKDALPALFELLKKGEEQEAKRALSSLLSRLQNEILLLQKEPSTLFIEQALDQLYSLGQFAEKMAADALEFLKLPPSDLRRLAAIKPIEALFFQKEDPALEKIYSLNSVLEKTQRRQNFLCQLRSERVNSELICSDLGILDSLSEAYGSALTNALQERWIHFVAELSGGELVQLSEMIDTLRNLATLPTWMQMAFPNKASFPELYREYQEALPLSKQLQEVQEQLSLIPVLDWGKLGKFESLFERLPLDLFRSDGWREIFLKKGMLSQILGLSFMSRFIDLFDDQYIKTFLGSSDIPQDQKLQNFRTIVEAYFSLLKAWQPLSTLTQEIKNWAFADFLDDIRTDVPVLFSSLDCSDLNPTDILEAVQFIPEEGFEELPQTTKKLIQEKFPFASLKEGSLLLVAERFASIETFQNYIEKIERAIASTNPLNERELFPPPHFRVDSEIYINIAKRQKTVNFEGYTLAALFTLIHQNINTLLTNLAIRSGLDQFERPSLLEATESKIRNLGFLMDETGQIKRPSLIGAKCSKTGLTLIYNLPLKLHGVTYEIQYNPLAEEVSLKINFVSIDNDLSAIAKLFTMGASLLGAKQIRTAIFEKDMQAFFAFDSSLQMNHLDLFLQCMHELTSARLKDSNQKVTTKFTDKFLSLFEKEPSI